MSTIRNSVNYSVTSATRIASQKVPYFTFVSYPLRVLYYPCVDHASGGLAQARPKNSWLRPCKVTYQFSTVAEGYNGFHARFSKFTGKIFNCDCDVQLSTAIQLFVISASTTQSLFSTLNCGSNFQPRFSFQRSAAIPTFNRDSVFQRSSAIPTFNHDSVFQLSSANVTFNCDWNSQPRFNFSTLKCDCNFQPRFDFQPRFQLSTAIRLSTAIPTFKRDSTFQHSTAIPSAVCISTSSCSCDRSILLMVNKIINEFY